MPLKLIKIKGSKNWYIRGTYKKQYVFQTTGTPEDDLADIELGNIIEDINNKKFHRAGKTITFGEAALAYRDGGGSARYLGEENDRGEWSSVLGQFIDTPLDEIGQKELDEAARRAYPGVKPQTLNRQFYTPFIAVWNFAAGDNPQLSRAWRRPKVRKSDVTRRLWFRKPEDAATFFMACAPHLRILFMFYLFTGARPTEGLELDITDLHLDDQWAVLSATKTDELRGVPLHAGLVECLRWYIGSRETGRVFLTGDGRPYTVHRTAKRRGGGQFKTAWRGAEDRSGLDGYEPYSLRHTFNNWLIRAGVADVVRDALMGHTRDSTNAIYSDVPQADLIREIERIPDFTDFLHKTLPNRVLFTQNSDTLAILQKEGKAAKARKIKEKNGAVEAD